MRKTGLLLASTAFIVLLASGVTLAQEADTTPPETTITSGPNSPTDDTTPTFTFTGSDDVSQAENLQYSYKVDWDNVGRWRVSGEWSAYSSETSVTLGDTSGLYQGSYTFYVKARDEAGNEDATPAQQSFQVDTPPAPPIFDPYTGDLYSREGEYGTLILEGYASELGTVDLFEGQNKVGTATIQEQDCPSGCFYTWFIMLEGVSEGTHTYHAIATDTAGKVSDPSDPYTVEVKIPPMVSSTVPAAGATGVRRGTNVVANFSEKMDKSTLTEETFKLFKMTATGPKQINNVTVTPSMDGTKVTLNPYGSSEKLLAKGTRYKAVVTTSAKDLAGNSLDEVLCPTFAYTWCVGLQPKVWSFKTTN